MGNRSRISNRPKGDLIEKDPLAFEPNLSSEHARRLAVNEEYIKIDVWLDKHYYQRLQLGEDNGERREGIQIDLIHNLIHKIGKHIIYYSLKVEGFRIVNFRSGNHIKRLVIQEHFEEQIKLNVIAEYHFLSKNQYEVTIKTAIRKNDFYYNDGQYLIELDKDGSSTLFKKDMGRVNKVSECFEFYNANII